VANLAGLAIHLLVPNGEAWLPVKAGPNFGHGRRWRLSFIATLLKALSLSLQSAFCSRLGCSVGNTYLGLSNRTMSVRGTVQRMVVVLSWSGVFFLCRHR
jgi:hypothetical protein